MTDKPVNTLDGCQTEAPQIPGMETPKAHRGRHTARGLCPELRAMHEIDKALCELDREARVRVLSWLNGVYTINARPTECNAAPLGQKT